MPNQNETQRNTFIQHLEELWSMEQRILEAMPTMIYKAHDMGLKNILRWHYAETLNQTSALRGIFKQLEHEFEIRHNERFTSILLEARDVLHHDDVMPSAEVDLLIITFCRQVEAYEIERYAAAAIFADVLHLEGIGKTLQSVLCEEKLALVKLNFAEKNIADRKPDEVEEPVNH